MAKKYYPVLWDSRRIELLAAAGRLTAEEAAEIVGTEKEAQK